MLRTSLDRAVVADSLAGRARERLLASAGLLVRTVQQFKLGIQASAPERVWFAESRSKLQSTRSGSLDFQEFPSPFSDHAGGRSVGAGFGPPPRLGSPRSTTGRGHDKVPTPSSHVGPAASAAAARRPPREPVDRQPELRHARLFCRARAADPPGPGLYRRNAANAPRVAIVNETLASRAFGNSARRPPLCRPAPPVFSISRSSGSSATSLRASPRGGTRRNLHADAQIPCRKVESRDPHQGD